MGTYLKKQNYANHLLKESLDLSFSDFLLIQKLLLHQTFVDLEILLHIGCTSPLYSFPILVSSLVSITVAFWTFIFLTFGTVHPQGLDVHGSCIGTLFNLSSTICAINLKRA